MKRLSRTLLTLGTCLGMCACGLQEDTVPCATGQVQLHFRYTYNAEGKDRLQAAVGAIWLYLFDERTGILLDVYPLPGLALEQGMLDAELPVGRYTILAWGGGLACRGLPEAGFRQVHCIDPHNYKELEPGATTLNDFRMMLEDPGSFDEIFFDIARGVAVEPLPTGSPRVDFDLVRYNNRLQVTVSGYQHLLDARPAAALTRAEGENPLDIHVSGQKGTYLHDGAIDPEAPVLRYNHTPLALDPQQAQVHIELLHLDLEHHTPENPVLLHLREEASQDPLLPPMDVLELIRQVRDENGQRVFATQEDIDRQEVFPIEIRVMKDLSVSITVKGFTIQELDPIIGPR